MANARVLIGDFQDVTGGSLYVDLPALVDGRALITGNSGAGKSRLLRRLVEQAFGKVQIIVLDPEGEFSTLREKHGFVLAGRGGEMPAEPRAAALMARRLMDLQASAVLDLYDLKIPQQREFGRIFFESLMELPRDQYRPVLVVIDEAQRFCPERGSGEAESTEAMITLMTQGRKRGLCGIPATQRLSMLHKDAAAQATNNFIGRTTLDVDQKRAAAVLGISSAAERVALRDLPLGVFLAYGPALSASGVVRFRGGEVFTTHPKAGQRHTLRPTATPEAIQKLAAELKDLPQQAAEEIRTLQAAQSKVRELERELRAAKKAQPVAAPAPPPKVVEKAILKDVQIKRLEVLAGKMEGWYGKAQATSGEAGRLASEIVRALAAAKQTQSPVAAAPHAPQNPGQFAARQARQLLAAGAFDTGEPLTAYAAGLLETIARRHPLKLRRLQVATLAGRKPRSSAFDLAMSQLAKRSLIEADRDGLYQLTPSGLQAAGSVVAEAAETPEQLRDRWKKALPGYERCLFDTLLEVHPAPLSREELSRQSGKSSTSSAFDLALSNLKKNGLTAVDPEGFLTLAEELFG